MAGRIPENVEAQKYDSSSGFHFLDEVMSTKKEGERLSEIGGYKKNVGKNSSSRTN